VASSIVALLTPFTERGDVDREALRAHVEFLLEEGIDGFFPAGTTGEGALLEADEVVAVLEAVVEVARGCAEVLAQVGRPSTRATIALARRAAELGVDAVAAVVPYYYQAGDEQLVRHYGDVVEALDGVPVLAYNIPKRTVNDLGPEPLRELARAGLAGVKDTSDSWERHREYLDVAREQKASGNLFRVLTGAEDDILRSLEHGSDGAVTALANVRPDLVRRLFEAFRAGRGEEAAAAQQALSRLKREVRPLGPTPVGVKRAVAETLAGRGVRYLPALRAPFG
jgi:dihydrodipicolinate synthase/N-acetylneuraminate lyase